MKRILIFFIGLMWLESAFSAADAQQNLAPEISTWKCRNGFVRMPGEGPNGTVALYYQRPADGVYALSPMPTKKLKPMTKYKFGAWVKAKKCKTLLERVPENEPIFNLIARAEKWLQENEYSNPIYKWETSEWGEIPADFGRK